MKFFPIIIFIATTTTIQIMSLDFAFKPKPVVTITSYHSNQTVKGLEETFNAQLKEGDYTETIFVQKTFRCVAEYLCVRKNCLDAREIVEQGNAVENVLITLRWHWRQQQKKTAQTTQVVQSSEPQK